MPDNKRSEKSPPPLWWRLFEPVDIASLVFFRVAFGALLLWEVFRYFQYGWIARYYIDPAFHFTYYGFGWVRPWAGNGMYVHFVVLGILAACILFGVAYRVATVLFFLAFTYVFLLDQTRYLNHFYLISLLSFLLIFLPLQRDPRRQTAPRWALWLVCAQFAIVYVYGAIAKMNGDWLRGEPLRMWLDNRTSYPIIGPLLDDEWMVMLFVIGGLLFDLLVVPLLLWHRTRPIALVMAIVFHFLNATLFRIGVFPWLAMAGILLFIPPDWPRRAQMPIPRTDPDVRYSKPIVALLAVFFLLQLVFPLRHFLYPGNVSWTEEGHRFSWRMKLRTKSGSARFLARNPITGEEREIRPRQYLKSNQVRTMSTHPDMILQFAHFLARELQREGWHSVEVRARVSASLNGRKRQLLIDPRVDLVKVKRNLLPASWIMPLTKPLREPLPDRNHLDEDSDAEE